MLNGTVFFYLISKRMLSKFYHRHFEWMVIYNIGSNALLKQGISEREVYGDLVYEFKESFTDQLNSIFKLYKKIFPIKNMHITSYQTNKYIFI